MSLGTHPGVEGRSESRLRASRAEQRETISPVSRPRVTDEDGIIIDWRERPWGPGRDIEFLRALLRRYFFLRLNLSFAVPPLAAGKSERDRHRLQKRTPEEERENRRDGIARQPRDRESDETHLAEVRTITPLLLYSFSSSPPPIPPLPCRSSSSSFFLLPLAFPFGFPPPTVLFFCKARLSEEPREVILYTSSFSTRRGDRGSPARVALTYLSGSSFPPL